MKLLFLDDIRYPKDVFTYIPDPIYNLKNWDIVRNYNDFVNYIKESKELPPLISFDHDLSDEHYVSNDFMAYKEKTGYDCAKWLVEYCLENNLDLPEYLSHSMNYYGKKRILQILNDFEEMKNNG